MAFRCDIFPYCLAGADHALVEDAPHSAREQVNAPIRIFFGHVHLLALTGYIGFDLHYAT